MADGLGAVVRVTKAGTTVTRGMQIQIKNLAETQAYFVRLLSETSGRGLEDLISKATARAHRYTTMIVHVDTGRLKNSLFPRTHGRGNFAYGIVGTNVAYAPYEHDRGGSHAFFERTVDEEGPAIIRQFDDDLAREVRR